MSHRQSTGWRYGKERDDEHKFHPLMVPYSDLPDEEKEKDRNAVRSYPAQIKAAGLEIVWL